MTMRVGRARHRITIETFTESQNAYGEPIKTWSTYATRWAEIRTLKGREFWTAQQTVSESPVEFRIRHDSVTAGVTSEMRIVWDGKNYDILDPQDVDGRGKDIIIMAKAGVIA